MIKSHLLAALLTILPALAVPGFSQRALFNDCVQSLSPDSVAVFFDAGYVLAPKNCAAIRRVGRGTDTGDFQGQVIDYRLSDNTILSQLFYQNAVMSGPMTLYFPNGQLAAQGQMSKGQLNGEWQYWYSTGQPRQVLRFLAEDPTRIIAFWDSTGRQLVYNGSGQWRGTSATGLQVRGQVAQGLPTGSWRGYHPASYLLVTTELYDRGTFRRGTLAQPQADQQSQYHYQALLMPHEPTPFLQATTMRLGYTCAESHRQAQFELIKTELQVPSVKIGNERYAARLTQRLLRYCDRHCYSTLPPKVTVRCAINQQGQFTAFESEAPAMREIIRKHVTFLPAWQPAHYQNAPMAGYLDVTLDTDTHVVQVRPAARLLPSQFPNPTTRVWP